jgi:hypothetical protein
MKNYYKVQGHENLYRDPNTGAIVSTEKPNRNKIKQHLDTTSTDINSLKEEIRELKLLLLEHIKKHG